MTSTPRSFEEEWPSLSRYVYNLLGSKGVRGELRNDLVQETGLRLFQAWDRVDHNRPLKSLTTTITLNLLRDELRRKRNTEILGDVPDAPASVGVEDAGLARIELQRVGRALTQLKPDHRLVLLNAAGGDETAAPRAHAAMKMLRMRARRNLVSILEATAVLAGACVMRARRVTGVEALSLVTAAAVSVAAPIAVVRPEGPTGGAAGSPRGAASSEVAGGRRVAPARQRPADRTERRAPGPAPTTPAVHAGGHPSEDDGSGPEPVEIGVGGSAAGGYASVRVKDVSVSVGQAGGPVPACAHGVPGLPGHLDCKS